VLAVAAACAMPLACRRGGGGSSPAPASSASALSSLAHLAEAAPSAGPEQILAARRAADQRIAGAVPSSLAGADPAGRRAYARALAQIADPEALPALRRALSDEDPEVVAWAAYGVASACDRDPQLGREARAQAVAALGARALTLAPPGSAPETSTPGPSPWGAIAWGLGRCGGADAAQLLAPWLALDEARARAAASALGSIAEREHGLEDDVVARLLDAARGVGAAGAAGDAGVRPRLVDALYPFGRGDWRGRPPPPQLADLARPFLATAAPGRIFAIRAYGRAEGAKVDDLRGLLVAEALPAERVEAIRALHRLGEAGDAEIAAFVTRNAPPPDGTGDATKLATSTGPLFGALLTAVELLGERAPSSTTKSSLRAIVPAGEVPIAAASAPIARRIALLRCAAAVALHRGAPGDPDLLRCAAHAPSIDVKLAARLDRIRDDARLSALDSGWIAGEKRELGVRLARDASPPVRERALSVLAKHPESGEHPELLVRALGAKEIGLVAAAAEAIAERPSIANRAKKKVERNREDEEPPPFPLAPIGADAGVTAAQSTDAGAAGLAADAGPSPPPPLDLDPSIPAALDGALARPYDEADDEARLALASAIGALRHAKGRGFLVRMCESRAYALRHAARRAFEQLDPPGAAPRCDVPKELAPASPLVDASASWGASSGHAATVTVRFETDAGPLELELDPTFAPVAVARIVELVRAGFYDGVVLHRVVPGFVVQLGDPGGDGYGGAKSSLRCETAPVPFARGDVGLALAGRDTGSSQIFVTLAPTPHLAGSYPWLGRAVAGDASALAEGDVITKATVTSGAPGK
jgi:cyclophilin family peptidyl-prolyl cis-trans isomerase